MTWIALCDISNQQSLLWCAVLCVLVQLEGPTKGYYDCNNRELVQNSGVSGMSGVA